MEDERFTQDLILVSPAELRDPQTSGRNATLERWCGAPRRRWPMPINPFDSHSLPPFHAAFSTHRCSRIPSRCGTTATCRFLLGEEPGVAVLRLKPCSRARTRIPGRPAENYLRDAMIKTLEAGPWTFDFMCRYRPIPS